MNWKLAGCGLVLLAAAYVMAPPADVVDVIAPSKPAAARPPNTKPVKPKPKPWGEGKAPVGADDWDDPKYAIQLPPEVRAWCRNPDGSCVQCSISIAGYGQNYPQASMLLWDHPEYGKAERGGGWPERTSKYAAARGMQVFNITGEAETFPWMKWACETGRGAAIGASASHFQTLAGHDPKTNTWYVVDNNRTGVYQPYDEVSFRRLHMASGPWCVINDTPPAPAVAQYVQWWK